MVALGPFRGGFLEHLETVAEWAEIHPESLDLELEQGALAWAVAVFVLEMAPMALKVHLGWERPAEVQNRVGLLARAALLVEQAVAA